jgi:hypothetical protein
MSRTLQWILGILAVVVIVGIIAGGAFMYRNRAAMWGYPPNAYTGAGGSNSPQDGDAPYGLQGYPRYHMYDRDWGMPMMQGRSYPGVHMYGTQWSPFMWIGGLFHLLLPLGILALVAYLFYQMGRRAGEAAASATRSPARPAANPLPARKVARR